MLSISNYFSSETHIYKIGSFGSGRKGLFSSDNSDGDIREVINKSYVRREGNRTITRGVKVFLHSIERIHLRRFNIKKYR